MPEVMKKVAKLIMVTENNNNKYYNMEDSGDGSFVARWGRVEGHETSKSYPMRDWDKKYREKVAKGYTDNTELFAVSSEKTDFATISDMSISKIISDLMAFANHSVSQNYSISSDAVTEKQINTAQQIIDEIVAALSLGIKVKEVNPRLISLYQTIPRKMKNVNDHLLQFGEIKNQDQLDGVEKLLADEQATLDVMRGQVKTGQAQKDNKDDKLTILDALGLVIEPTSKTDVKNVKNMLGEIENKYFTSFRITNKRTQAAYDKFVKKSANKTSQLFWHGSRNENWWSIMDSGLVLRPANAVITGKMFGYGLYFADKAKKSYGYTSGRGSYWARGSSNRAFMTLYDVHLGNSLKIKHHESWCYDLTESKLKARGDYDSLFALGGADLRNNEYIVYNQSQCTARFFVELRD